MSDEKYSLHFGSHQLQLDQKTLPYLLVGGGLLVLLIGQVGFWKFWPLFVLLPGISLIYASQNRQTPDALDQLKGGIITTATGAILLYQSLTNHWASWAYIWAIYPLLGAGYLEYLEGKLRGKERKIMEGLTQMRIWGGVLGASAVVFEVFIFRNVNPIGLGIGLLALGAVMLQRQRSRHEVDFDELMDKPKHDSETKYKPKRKTDQDSDIYEV